MFWTRYVELCSSVNKSPHKVATSIGVTAGSVTGWKNGGIPRETTLKKIADYFGVTVEYLKGESEVKNPAADKGNGIEEELIKLFSRIPAESKKEAMNYLRYLADQKMEE